MPTRLRRQTLAATATVASLALAGCGSGAPSRSAPAATTAPAIGAGPSAESALFARSCGGCHTIGGRESPRHQGGDLLHLRIGRAAMLEFVAEMPVRRALSHDEIRRVSDYVLAIEAQGR